MTNVRFECDFSGVGFCLDFQVGELPHKVDDKWQPLKTVLLIPDGYQVEEDSEIAKLYAVLAKVYDLGGDTFQKMQVDDPKAVLDEVAPLLGTATMTSDSVEWTLEGLWPHQINFGDLCYSTSSEMEIEVLWRFFNATERKL